MFDPLSLQNVSRLVSRIDHLAVGVEHVHPLSSCSIHRCFMPLLPVSLISTVLPVLLSVLAIVALISYTCVFWSRWEDAKSIYQDSFNRTEIPLLLILFCLVFLSSLAAYLHTYIGLTYTMGAFIILNTLEVSVHEYICTRT
jgi:hypothetical protein